MEEHLGVIHFICLLKSLPKHNTNFKAYFKIFFYFKEPWLLKTLAYLVPSFCLSPGPKTLKNGFACLRFCFIFTNIVFHLRREYLTFPLYIIQGQNLIKHWVNLHLSLSSNASIFLFQKAPQNFSIFSWNTKICLQISSVKNFSAKIFQKFFLFCLYSSACKDNSWMQPSFGSKWFWLQLSTMIAQGYGFQLLLIAICNWFDCN